MSTLKVTTVEDRHIRSRYEAMLESVSIFRRLNPNMEHFVVILLDARNRAREFEIIASGSAGDVCVTPLEVYRAAIKHGAESLFAAHNHPSGNGAESEDDIKSERRLAWFGQQLGFRFRGLCTITTNHSPLPKDDDTTEILVDLVRRRMEPSAIAARFGAPEIAIYERLAELCLGLSPDIEPPCEPWQCVHEPDSQTRKQLASELADLAAALGRVAQSVQ